MQTAASSSNWSPSSTKDKLRKLMDESHMLCKKDILWILDYIKQKVAEKDPALLNLHQPRLLKNFHCFTEVAMLMVHKRHQSEHEHGEIKALLREACFGLLDEIEQSNP